MIADPPVRADGRCARDGCAKVRRPPSGRYATLQDFATEPFCSTECCRAWHGVPLRPIEPNKPRGRPRNFA